MENSNMFSRLVAALKTLIRFGCQHAASQEAMKKCYTRSWTDAVGGDPCKISLCISRAGQLYEVTRGYFVHDQFKVTEKWLATYGWHSNGHLVALGRTTYVVFDPVRKLVFVEDFPDQGSETLEVYHEA